MTTIDAAPPRWVVGLAAIDDTQRARVGGKGAHLAALSRMEGVAVPAGFVVTTDAFEHMYGLVPGLDESLDQLSHLQANERDAIRTLSARLRTSVEEVAMPDDIAATITDAVTRLGAHDAYAVRSSATAEDLPSASFAGQQDTFLNVVGPAAVLEQVRACWASLFTERAVTYRIRNGFEHSKVRMAVVVQQMVFPHAAGTVFTADPVSSHRKITSVEATFGLGEALVSGLVNADVYRVRDGDIVHKAIAPKQLAARAAPDGGTELRPVAVEQRQMAALTDAQVVRIAALARRIERHFGRPQDIEWCLVDDTFHIVQSRPITTLFPIPVAPDGNNHVYISVGHGQMMTDAMKPLGLSLFQLTALRPMVDAGGRLFVDVTRGLASPASRAALLELFGKSEPLVQDALQTILDRGDFVPTLPNAGTRGAPPGTAPAPAPPAAAAPEPDPTNVAALIKRSETALASSKRTLSDKVGTALIDAILADTQELKRTLTDPQNHEAIMASMDATWWLNEKLEAWLGEKNAAHTLAQSVAHNVTSEMGLALLDVADVIRPHADVVELLRNVVVDDDTFLDALPAVAGGADARAAIVGWLGKYGMRCVGEIDITRPRFCERPSTLVPLILSNIQNFEPGAGARRFEQGREQARTKEAHLLARLRALPDGAHKADEAKKMIDRLRAFAGYREYPKYGMVSRSFVYKRALMEEALRLVKAGALREKDDIFFLSLSEVRDLANGTLDGVEQRIRERRDAFASFQTLTPPRVLTSDGECIGGAYRRGDVPRGALVGLAVSAGTVEGRARVIHDLAHASFERGDILVTAYTDPSWTPAFVAIQGLVTEVGGLTTHGAVIAREYGLPAVVGVENATRLIRDGEQIRVHGTDGYVEILSARHGTAAERGG